MPRKKQIDIDDLDLSDLEGEGLFDYFSPRNDYNNTSKRTLESLGAGDIIGVTICRAPIKRVLDKVMDIISAGKFSELKKKYGFDRFYHLSLILDLDLGGARRRVLIEKNAVINITSRIQSEPDAEYFQIKLNGKLTLSKLMDQTRAAMGVDYFTYDAFTNNCQVFIDNILKDNGLLTTEAHNFLFQNIAELSKRMPKISKQIAQAATTTGAVIDKMVGNGKPSTEFSRSAVAAHDETEPWRRDLTDAERLTMFNDFRRNSVLINVPESWGHGRAHYAPEAIRKKRLLMLYKEFLNYGPATSAFKPIAAGAGDDDEARGDRVEFTYTPSMARKHGSGKGKGKPDIDLLIAASLSRIAAKHTDDLEGSGLFGVSWSDIGKWFGKNVVPVTNQIVQIAKHADVIPGPHSKAIALAANFADEINGGSKTIKRKRRTATKK